MKRITRIIAIVCPACLGTKQQQGRPCARCFGTGEIDKRIVELVPDDADEFAEALQRNAGAHT